MPLLVGALFVAGAVTSASAQTKEPVKKAPDVTVSVSGTPVEFRAGKPMIQDESVLVPFRAVLEKMGANVSYDAASRLIRATQGKRTVEMTPGSAGVKVDGRRFNLKVAPKEVNGTVYIPLRFVGESLGAKVMYDKLASAVTIEPNKTPVEPPTSEPSKVPMNQTTEQPKPPMQAPPAMAPVANEPAANAPAANAPPANEPPANEPLVNEPPMNQPPANVPPTNDPAPMANTAPIVNTPPADTKPTTPIATTPAATVPTTQETSEPANLSWLPWLLGALVLAGIAVAAYLVIKNNRAGQVIASSDDTKRK